MVAVVTVFRVTQVNALLPTDAFLAVMQGLMGNELASVRRKAMELLNNKLQQRTQWAEPQVRTRDWMLLVGVVSSPDEGGTNADDDVSVVHLQG